MGMSATSFTGNGLRDWLLQRFTAVVLAAYTFFLMGYFLTAGPIDYAAWSALFSNLWMKVATTFMLVAVLIHAWIGVWTVITDYVALYCMRLLAYTIVLTVLVSSLIWGLKIVWSN